MPAGEPGADVAGPAKAKSAADIAAGTAAKSAFYTALSARDAAAMAPMK
jgi:hypothetical protein